MSSVLLMNNNERGGRGKEGKRNCLPAEDKAMAEEKLQRVRSVEAKNVGKTSLVEGE